MAIGDIIFVGDEQRKIIEEFLVRRPVSESQEERSKRIAARMPEPTFGYTVIRTEKYTPTEQDAPTP